MFVLLCPKTEIDQKVRGPVCHSDAVGGVLLNSFGRQSGTNCPAELFPATVRNKLSC